MTERVNLVDAYDNRSVVAKLVSMEERISGAETSVEASAEAAATSASKAAVSQTAAKTSEANAKASADTAASILSNTVDLSSKQTITGAKTFAGDTTVTGQLISSGTNTLSGTTELEGTVELDSTAVATLNGKVTASNTGNSIKVANHDSVLTSNDVLSAKDINTPNGDANSLVHRSGDEAVIGKKEFELINTTNTIKGVFSQKTSTWVKMCSIPTGTSRNHTFIICSIRGAWPSFGMFHTENDYGGFPRCYWVVRRWNSSNSALSAENSVALVKGITDGYYDVWVNVKDDGLFMGCWLAIQSTTYINDIIWSDGSTTTDDITSIGASNIYYTEDYPYGGGE